MWRRPLTVLCKHHGFLKGSCGGVKGMCGRQVAYSVPALPTASITALQAIALWERCFEDRGISEPRCSSQYIIAHLLGAKTIESLEREKLTACLSRDKTEKMWELCTRRLSRMPVQYVIEEWDFRDLTLKMRPPVFIPRPETEELVGIMLADMQVKHGNGVYMEGQYTCLEVGSGSGAISLSLLKKLPQYTGIQENCEKWAQLKIIALDQSQDAVELTRENALRLGLQDRLQVHHVDILKDADAVVGLCGPVSMLVSNPPYLFSDDMTSLEPEILRFEDHAALDGGHDGLKVITQILTLAPKILINHGPVYLEVDPRHPPLIQRWVEDHVEGLQYVDTRHDITDRPRFCILQKAK